MNENSPLVAEEGEPPGRQRQEASEFDEEGQSEESFEEEDDDEDEDEYSDWDTSCLEDEELAFEGAIDEEGLKVVLFQIFQTLLFLKPELRDISLKVVFYSGMEAEDLSPYLCEYETSKEVVPLLGDLLTALILEADPVGGTFQYNDGPSNHPDGYSASPERISYTLEELGDVTARVILLSPDRLNQVLLTNGFDLRKFKLGQELLAKGCKLEAPSA